MPHLRRLLPCVLAVAAGALAAPAAAPAAVAWASCAARAGYECARVAVPLDHTGVAPGQISLNVTRRRAPSNPGGQAVVALAGGPGQAAVPIATAFASDLAAGLTTRDLLVFDQRGTGASNPLRCSSLYTASTITAGVRGCAAEVGPARQFFRTADSVADLEALRVAAGYDKLVLYGVSYGTRVAEAYAATHPTHTAGLILDSVVTPTGPDALQRSSLAALKRVLRELCAGRECRGATADAVGDLRKLARKLAKRSLRGPVISGTGRRYTARLGETGLWNILVSGDLNPTLRAEFPGSVRAALTGDVKPILRLSARAEGLVNLVRHQTDSVDDDDVTFFTTTCEENATIPWTRGASESQRAAEVTAAAKALPAALTDPFSYRPALDQIPRICLGYPVAAPLVAAPAALPQVPTLIIDGLADLRTPVEDARAVQSAIPGAQLVGVPFSGHSVLGSEPGECAAKAVRAFFAGTPVLACGSTDNPFSPTPRPPLSLSRVTRQPSVAGVRGRTITAVLLTETDARRQVIGEALAGDGTLPTRVGGLRAGYVRPSSITRYALHGYEYVPGVRVSGTSSVTGTSRLTVSGSKAARGTLTISPSGRVTGRLGGRRVSSRLARAARHDTTGAWPTLARALTLRPRVR